MVDKIRKLCAENNLSLRALEREMGFANGTIANWDKNRPSVDKVAAVAKRFGKPMEYFVETDK